MKKIMLLVDVKSWAWGIKARYIQKYLNGNFSVDIRYMDDGDPVPREDTHDLYVTFWTRHLSHIERFPIEKRITGITSLAAYKRIIGMNFDNKCAAFHANNMELYTLARSNHSKVYYVPNGVDTSLFKPKNRIPKGNLIIGYVGKRDNIKGYNSIIINISKYERGIILKTNTNRWNKATPHIEMPDFYNSIDVYIVASLAEGTPNPALEAAACGKPIISTKVGNMPEFIEHGKNGFLVNRNINDFVNKIKQLKSNPDKCLEMGKNARKQAEKWDWKIQSENYRKMFKEVLNL